MAMDQIRGLVWEGALNVQIAIRPSLLVVDVDPKEATLNLRIPRNIYFTIYLPTILSSLRNYLRIELSDNDQHFWLEFENVPLFWNYPVGVLYDSMTGLNPSEREKRTNEDSLVVWKLELVHGTKVPPGLIPLVGGSEQIRSYWMHQWKQACFLLNGSSKQVMSLSMRDSKRFWDSITTRDYKTFDVIVAKVLPLKPRLIPVLVHQILPEMKLFQPVVTELKADGSKTKIIDLIESLYSGLFRQDTEHLLKLVTNGVEIPPKADLYELYLRFMSLDGFLHLSMCLLSDSELAESNFE